VPAVPSRPLSYSAIAAFEECAYRFYMERVLDLGDSGRTSPRIAEGSTTANREDGTAARETRAAQGAAVHSLLQWSQGNEWQEPSRELAERHAVAAGIAGEVAESLLTSVRAWLGSELLAERIAKPGVAVHAEAPLLLGIAGTVMRGSIDLLVEREDHPPLVIDYKTDRLAGSSPAEHATRYGTQRDIYALAVAESRKATEVEVAYVFLECPEDPVITTLGPTEMEAGRGRLAAAIERIEQGNFPAADPQSRDWDLCRGCPALGRTCSGPNAV
jgi:RecB family exonuclease